MKKKIKINDIQGLIIAGEFFLLILLSLIFFNREPGRQSSAENRNLAVFPAIRGEDGRLSPDLKEDLEEWFEDNLGLRDQYLTLSGIINYNLFDRARTPKVEPGDNGFLYLADEGNLSLEASKSEDFINDLPEHAAFQQRVSSDLLARGIDYVFYIAPGKPSVYPEYIRSSDHRLEDTIGDALYDELRENTDVHVCFPKDALTEAKKDPANGLIYLQTDTHWSCPGRDIAIKEFVSDLKGWGIIDSDPANVEFFTSDEPYVGDLSNMIGPVTWSGKRLTEDKYTDWKIVDPKAYEITSGERYEAFQDLLYEKNVYNPELCVMYANDKVPEKKVLIFGDSMFGTCLLPQLAESFSELTFVWSYRIQEEFIDELQPDLVISQFGERELPLRLYDTETGYTGKGGG